MGTFCGKNRPTKENVTGLKGWEAKSGKSNFDISEWLLIKLSKVLFKCRGTLAMLVKTSVARKVFRHNFKNNLVGVEYRMYKIDAQREFNVAVEACLFIATFSGRGRHNECQIYSGLGKNCFERKIGIGQNGTLISNLDKYRQTKHLGRGSSPINGQSWRSGIKHDVAKVMELQKDNMGRFINGLNEVLDIEDDFIFPLLKSSDLANNRTREINKFVIVTQSKIGEETEKIKYQSPKLWNYLTKYQNKFSSRKSSIYQNRPPFSIFGVGSYSFKPYKVAISGLYKKINFCLLSPYQDKEIMLDDTCYFIGLNTFAEAQKYYHILQKDSVQDFIQSLVFLDAKRPINIDILNSLDLEKV